MLKSSSTDVLLALLLGACVSSAPEEATGDTKIVRGAPALTAEAYDGVVLGMPLAGTVAPMVAGAGAPVAGIGAPVAGAGAPVAGAGAPIAGAGTPVAGTGAPVAGAGAPVAGTGAPAAGAGAPVAGTGAPAAGAGAPVAGTGAPVAGTGAPVATGTPGTLTVSFTSIGVGGRYAPRNVGAVWIETGTGAFVKTLKRWAAIRANHLAQWNAAAGGWFSFFGIGATQDELDAVTAATLRTHEAHHVTWDMVDNNGAVVADGAYRVRIEVADDNLRPSGATAVDFTKGPAPSNASSSQSPVSGLTLTYTP